jgi:hypothetical protein
MSLSSTGRVEENWVLLGKILGRRFDKGCWAIMTSKIGDIQCYFQERIPCRRQAILVTLGPTLRHVSTAYRWFSVAQGQYLGFRYRVAPSVAPSNSLLAYSWRWAHQDISISDQVGTQRRACVGIVLLRNILFRGRDCRLSASRGAIVELADKCCRGGWVVVK